MKLTTLVEMSRRVAAAEIDSGSRVSQVVPWRRRWRWPTASELVVSMGRVAWMVVKEGFGGGEVVLPFFLLGVKERRLVWLLMTLMASSWSGRMGSLDG